MVQFKIMGGLTRTRAAQMKTTVRCKSVKPVTGGLARKARTKTSQSKGTFQSRSKPLAVCHIGDEPIKKREMSYRRHLTSYQEQT